MFTAALFKRTQNTYYIRRVHVPKLKNRFFLGQARVVFMATSTGRKRVRFTLDVTFPSTECKDALLARLTSVRDKMTPPGVAKLDNYGLLSQLFSLAESRPSPAQLSQEEDQEVYSVPRNMLSSCGKYTAKYV